MKKRVLFLCTHNSARSQMAEGLLRKTAGDEFEVFSAGTEETRVHPLAIEAMLEIGIDIGGQRSKTLDTFNGQRFDYVITVCDRANETCPHPQPRKKLGWLSRSSLVALLAACRSLRCGHPRAVFPSAVALPLPRPSASLGARSVRRCP
ncbi:MAG: arsenate reductase ArsC [Thermoanaerobaculia bacterium]